MTYARHFNPRKTPQKHPIPGREKEMEKSAAGGYLFTIDSWDQLDRFLVLGAEGGTYYVGEREMTLDNARNVLGCIREDGVRVVERVKEVSDKGIAPKNEPAIFVLALCASADDKETRKFALEALPVVCRTSTHLFHFVAYCDEFRGWGRGLRNAISKWYLGRSVESLAYQVVKYQSRDGWSHRDLLRLAHPNTDEPDRDAIFRWITQGEVLEGIPNYVKAFEEAKTADARKTVQLINEYNLTREMVMTEHLDKISVQKALLEKMPIMALIRNLGNFSKSEFLTDAKPDVVVDVCAKITDKETLSKYRVHPLNILTALHTYSMGQGFKGRGEWNPVGRVIDALDEAFYKAFEFVEPTDKAISLWVDASGSMTAQIFNSPLSCRQAAIALALVTASTESRYMIGGFTQGDHYGPLPITPRMRLDDAMNELVRRVQPRGTDASLPFKWAIDNQAHIDCFVLLTDNETWAGSAHPIERLNEYRQKFNQEARAISIAMTATRHSVFDPDEKGTLNVVGFDLTVPKLIQEFAKGNI